MKRDPIVQRFLACVAFLIFAVLTSGCAGPTVRTYSGDKLQKSEVAVIKGWYYFGPLYYSSIDIYKIDDKDKSMGLRTIDELAES